MPTDSQSPRERVAEVIDKHFRASGYVVDLPEVLLEAFPQLAEEQWEYRARVEVVSADANAIQRGWDYGNNYISQSTPFTREQMDNPELYEDGDALNLLEGCRLVEPERRRRAGEWEKIE